MANLFHLESARDDLLKIAKHYEQMAAQAELREIAQGISHLNKSGGVGRLTRMIESGSISAVAWPGRQLAVARSSRLNGQRLFDDGD